MQSDTATNHNKNQQKIIEASQLVGKDQVRAWQLLEPWLSRFSLGVAQPSEEMANCILAYKTAAHYFHYNREYRKCYQYASIVIKEINKIAQNAEDKKDQGQKQREEEQLILGVRYEALKLDCQFLLADALFYCEKHVAAGKAFEEIIKITQRSKKDAATKEGSDDPQLTAESSTPVSSSIFTEGQITKKLRILRDIIEKIPSQDNNEQLKEAQLIREKMKESDDCNYMKRVGLPVYVIPTRWWKRWKRYVKFEGEEGIKESEEKEKNDQAQKYNYVHELKGDQGEQQQQNCTMRDNPVMFLEGPSTSDKNGATENGFVAEADDAILDLESWCYPYPGEIESGDICETYPSFFQDFIEFKDPANYKSQRQQQQRNPISSQSHQPIILKTGLSESDDFELVSGLVGRALHSIYGGDIIKRVIQPVNDDENNQEFMVDLSLKLTNYVIFPGMDRAKGQQDKSTEEERKLKCCEVIKVNINKKETLRMMTKFIARQVVRNNSKDGDDGQDEFEEEIVSRLWKVTRLQLEDIRKQQQQQQLQQHQQVSPSAQTPSPSNPKPLILLVHGQLLTDLSTSIDESEIGEDDVILFEWKTSETEPWLIFLKDTHTHQCACCARFSDDLWYCECEIVMYCNEQCQRKHRHDHKAVCLKKKQEKKNKQETIKKYQISVIPDEKQQQKQTEHCQSALVQSIPYNERLLNGICGLQNLGNTCFMNSSIQCLSNVYELSGYLISNLFVDDLNKDNPLGSGGYLAVKYSELIKSIWKGTDSPASPWDLKKIISKFAPQFSGYSQHDSHELLCYLVDGIHEDLNRVKSKPVVSNIESDGKDDLAVAQKSWEIYRLRNHSIISDLMVGQFKSTIVCPSCKKVSVTFDPFLTISLPIPQVQKLAIKVFVQVRDTSKELAQVEYQLKYGDTVGRLKKIIEEEFKMGSAKDISFSQQIIMSDGEIIELADSENLWEIVRNMNSDKERSWSRSNSQKNSENHGYFFAFETRNINGIDGDLKQVGQEEQVKKYTLIISKIGRQINIFVRVYHKKAEEVQVRWKIKMAGKNKKSTSAGGYEDVFENVSYIRMFSILGNDKINEMIHLKIWGIYRKYLMNTIKKDDQRDNDKPRQQNQNASSLLDLMLDTEKQDIEFLKDEYNRFLAMAEKLGMEYVLQVESTNESMEIKYDVSENNNTTNQRGLKGISSSSNQLLNLLKTTNSNSVFISLLTRNISNLHPNQYLIQPSNMSNSATQQLSLSDCLDLYIQEEILEKGNEWYCSTCKEHQQAFKKIEIFRTPQILVFHIKRFKTNRPAQYGNYYYSLGGQKIEELVDFPLTGLDLRDYVLSNKMNTNTKSSQQSSSSSTATSTPLSQQQIPQSQSQSSSQQESSLIYDLFAVSNHYGTLSGGHYTAYGLNHLKNEWYHFNDSSVNNADTNEIVSKAAYILFYRRRQNNSKDEEKNSTSSSKQQTKNENHVQK